MIDILKVFVKGPIRTATLCGLMPVFATRTGVVIARLCVLFLWGVTPSLVAGADPIVLTESSKKDVVPRASDAPQWSIERLPRSVDVDYKVLSPDRTMVAWVGANLNDVGKSEHGLFIIELASGRIRQLVEQAIKTAPAWSPDSRRLAVGNAGGYLHEYPLALVDVVTGEIESTDVMGVGAVWSPDGAEVAVATEFHRWGSWSAGVPTDGRIGIYNLKERTMRHVTPEGYYASTNDARWVETGGSLHPVWSPNGEWIAFELVSHAIRGEQKVDRREIWAVNRQGTEMRRLSKDFQRFQWASNGEAIELEGGERIPVATAPIVSANDWPKLSDELREASKPREIDFDPSKVFARNKAWQNPDIDHLKSVEFVHQMKPTRFDERFSWRADGAFSVEIIRSDYPNTEKDVGRLSLLTPAGEQLTLATASHYPSKQKIDGELQRREVLGHLMGTRFNCVALDWGRFPQRFELTDIHPASEQGKKVLTLIPKPEADRRPYRLNFGAMFHSMSFAYVHDLYVEKSELTVDEQSSRIIKEVDFMRDNEPAVFEFGDWLDVDGERSVPLSINISYPFHQFHVEYKFQWLPEGWWLLKSGKSWFEDKEPQYEELIDLVIDKSPTLVDHQLEHLQSRLAALESNQKGLTEQQSVTLNPWKLGETFSLQWSRSDVTTDRIQNVRFTVSDQKEGDRRGAGLLSIRMELELKESDKPINTLPGQLVLYDEEGRPVDVYSIPWASAELIRRPESRDILVFDLGSSRFWQYARQWSLTTPIAQAISEARTSSGKVQTCEAVPIRWNEDTLIDVRGPKSTMSGKIESWLREMQLEHRDDGRIIGTFELVSGSHLTEQWGTIAAVLLDHAGLPIAAAEAQQRFRVENDVYSEKATLDFGVLPSGARAERISVGFKLIHTGTLTGSRMMTFMDRAPTIPIVQLLNSSSPEIIQIGLEELYRDARLNIRIRERNLIHRNQRLIASIAPYSNRLEELFTLPLTPDSLALLCRLAGHSGQPRFVPLLNDLRNHPNAEVQDSAAIGLGLLGYSRERSRLQAIYARTKEIEEPSLEIGQIKTEVEIALEELGESLGSR